MNAPAIRLEHVKKSYRNPVRREVFEDANLEVEAGELVAAVGPIGSGKTTLVKLIAGLIRPTSGEIYVQDVKTAHLNGEELAHLRTTRMGIVYQVHDLIPHLTVSQNIELPMFLMGVEGERRTSQVKEVLNLLGMSGERDRKVATLSVGERQMCTIARSLATDPPILLMDEPTESLDPLMGEVVISSIRGASMLRGKAIFVTSHDRRLIDVADRVIHVKKLIP